MDLDISRLNLTIFWRKIMSKNIVPKVRFKSFDKVWESYQLSEYSTYRRGSFPQPYGNKEWYGGDNAMPFVQVVDVLENLRLVADTKQKISTLAQPMSVFVPSDSVIVTLQGSIGRVAITQYDAYVDRTILIFEDYNSQTNKEFWAYTIRNKFEIERQKAPGGTIKTITKEALSDFKVSIPEYTEQSAIGSLFRTLDDLLASYKDNLANYQSLKTTMLSKMFPKAGQTVPEIRLDGFEGEWGEKELGDIVKFYSGLTYKPSDVLSYGTLVLRSSNVRDGELIYLDNVFVNPNIVNCQNVKSGDIVVVVRNGSRDLIGKHALIRSEMPNTVIGAFMTGVRCDNPEFINALLDTKVFISEIHRNLGSTINQITTGNFKKMKFYFPLKDEQRAIGSYFSNLDKLINSYQEKISQLETLKKKLLQDMFI